MLTTDVLHLTPTDRYLYWIRERHAIYLKRQRGEPPPWTDDAILQENFFTHPYREHDKMTAWFRTHVRDPLCDDPRVILATIIFRWFNFIPTGEVLVGGGRNLLLDWSEDDALARLAPIRDAGVKIFYRCADWPRMQRAHEDLLRFDGLGDFMVYEIVCDLRYTSVLEHATDKLTWCNAGPGAIRGLYRLLGREIRNKSNACSLPLPHDWDKQTRRLLALVHDRLADLPPFEMREIEHSLCEYDKYVRVLLGEGRSKRRYPGQGKQAA